VSGMPRHAWVGIGFVLGWFGSRSPAHSQCAVRACCHAPCRFRNRGARLSRGVCAADASEKWRPRLVGPGVGGWFWAGRRWGGVCRGSFRTLLTDSGRAVRRWGFQFTARMPFVLVLEQLHWAFKLRPSSLFCRPNFKIWRLKIVTQLQQGYLFRPLF
jgi:hypothetical protein